MPPAKVGVDSRAAQLIGFPRNSMMPTVRPTYEISGIRELYKLWNKAEKSKTRQNETKQSKTKQNDETKWQMSDELVE